MQLLAIITMLIDHIGYFFFPYDLEWRMIGRVAFPLYAYAIVLGYTYTSNLQRYLFRLVILAIVSQLPFMFAFQTMTLNVVVTLLLSLLIVVLLDRMKNVYMKVVIVVISAVIMAVIPMDYGPYGLLLIIIYRYAKSYWLIAFHFLLNVCYFLYTGVIIQSFSLLATILILYLPQLWDRKKFGVPDWIWRSFYPAHLLILGVIYQIYISIK